MAFEKQNAVI